MENQFNIPVEPRELEIDTIARDQELVRGVTENADKFVSWFENFKDAIAAWPDKYFTDRAIRNSILVASIPFAVLKAGQLDVRAEGFEMGGVDMPTVSKNLEREAVPQRVVSSEFLFLEDGPQKEAFTQRVNDELEVFDALSKPLNDVVGRQAFDFSGHMIGKIREANKIAESLSEVGAREGSSEKRDSAVRNILEDGRLSFAELVKVFPEIVLAKELSVVVHESGHVIEAYKQGATSAEASFSLSGGYTRYSGKLANKTAFDAAGINADKKYGDLITNTLRAKDAPSQLAAIMALVAKSDGMFYALATNFSAPKRNTEGNDIVAYAKETNTPIADLAIGLTASFLLDRDNWQLLRVALGEKGVKLPEATISPTYELGDYGPRIGVTFRGLF